MAEGHAEANNLLIPRATCVHLDRRASIGRWTGTFAFFVLLFGWAIAVPLWAKERHPQFSGNELLAVSFAGFIVSGLVAWLAVSLIGGRRTELKSAAVVFSPENVHFGELFSIARAEVRKARVRRCEIGCIDVVLHLRDGSEIRIDPRVSSHLDQEAQRSRRDALCELIRAQFGGR